MKQNINLYKLKSIKFLHSHQTFVVILVLLVILFVVFARISMLSAIPLDQDYLTKKSGNVKAVNFDEDAIEQIKSLRDSNVEAPGTELPQNRQNPFSE